MEWKEDTNPDPDRKTCILRCETCPIDTSRLQTIIERIKNVDGDEESLAALIADAHSLVFSKELEIPENMIIDLIQPTFGIISLLPPVHQLLEMIIEMTDVTFSDNMIFVLEHIITFVEDGHELCSKALDIFSNALVHNKNSRKIIEGLNIHETVFAMLPCDDFSVWHFVVNYLKFCNKSLDGEVFVRLGEIALSLTIPPTLDVICQVLKSGPLLETLQELGLNEWLMEWLSEGPDDCIPAVLDVITDLALQIDSNSSFFDMDDMFKHFHERVMTTSEEGLKKALKVAYWLHPLYSEELRECGFTGEVLSLANSGSFQVSRRVCKYLNLVVSDMSLEDLVEVIDEEALDVLVSLLDMHDVKLTLQITEIIVNLVQTLPDHFVPMFSELNIIECLESLLEEGISDDIRNNVEWALMEICDEKE